MPKREYFKNLAGREVIAGWSTILSKREECMENEGEGGEVFSVFGPRKLT